MLTLSLVDVTGRQILTQQVTKTLEQLDFNNLASGVYVVKITSQEGGITWREIVKN